MFRHARGATWRGCALLLFFVQLIASFAWSPLFFGQHQVTSALYLIIFILMVTVATAFAFAPMRKAAAWLLVPYMAWLSFATIQIGRASCRAKVCPYVLISVVAGSLKKKTNNKMIFIHY